MFTTPMHRAGKYMYFAPCTHANVDRSFGCNRYCGYVDADADAGTYADADIVKLG